MSQLDSRNPEPERPEPGESGKERVDRELIELLQELRVSTTGIQVLFAFLLILPFQQRFSEVGPLGYRLFFVALLSGALASVCFIAPAAQHRLLFRTSLKETMLRRANRIGIVGLVFLMVSMASAIALVVDVVIGRPHRCDLQRRGGPGRHLALAPAADHRPPPSPHRPRQAVLPLRDSAPPCLRPRDTLANAWLQAKAGMSWRVHVTKRLRKGS